MLTSQHKYGGEHMSKYAVKIGEIQVRSDKPISEEERKRATKQLLQAYRGVLLITEDGLEVISRQLP